MSRKYEFLTLCAVLGDPRAPGVIPSLNGLAMVNTTTGATKFWDARVDYPGENFNV